MRLCDWSLKWRQAVFSVRCEWRPKEQVTVSFARQVQGMYRKRYISPSVRGVRKV
jgi:hypothetical protein